MVEDAGEGTRCRTMTPKLCHELSCQPHEHCSASLPHEVPQKGLFIFSPDCFPQSYWGWAGEGDTLLTHP